MLMPYDVTFSGESRAHGHTEWEVEDDSRQHGSYAGTAIRGMATGDHSDCCFQTAL